MILITVILVGIALIQLSYIKRKLGWKWLRIVMGLVLLTGVINLWLVNR